MTGTVNLSTEEQAEVLDELLDVVDEDDQEGFVDVDRPDRGPTAGEVPAGEAFRVAGLACLGRL